MRYLIIDLEATCWKTASSPARMETIEIGAVLLAGASGLVEREFAAFVRPVAEPLLSEFCVALTTIRQSDVDSAERFSIVFWELLDWIGPDPFIWCSWGGYDLRQLQIDCERHGMA